MAPKVTSSRDRAGRKPAKPPVVTTSKGRGNRSAVSTAKPTSGSNGKPSGGGARVTNGSQRTSTGSAPVTGGSKPSLPPGQRGGTPTKPSSSKPTPPRSNGGPVQPVRVRDMGKPSNSLPSGGARGLLGPGGAPPKAVLDLLNKVQPSLPAGKGGGRVNMGGTRGGLLLAAGRAAADYVGTKAGNAIGGFLRNQTNQSRNDTRRNTPGGRSNPGRSSGKPATDGRYIPGSQQTEIKDRSGRQSNESRPEAPKLPAAVTRKAPAGPTPLSSAPKATGGGSNNEKNLATWAQANPTLGAAAAKRQATRGTSKTDNPLMKGMIARMKQREDEAASANNSKKNETNNEIGKASKDLKFNSGTDSGYQLKDKVDGSKVDTKAKMSSTMSEYDKKKRRYGS